MKISRTWLIVPLTAVLATAAFAGMTKDSTKSLAPVRQLKPQTVCPVMGNAIDSAAYTDIQGQRVYHCCPMCSAKLVADPDKYFKKAAEDGILFENIQTTCPVTGAKLAKKDRFVDYEGRRVFFCSDSCATQFQKDPTGYLEKLDK